MKSGKLKDRKDRVPLLILMRFFKKRLEFFLLLFFLLVGSSNGLAVNQDQLAPVESLDNLKKELSQNFHLTTNDEKGIWILKKSKSQDEIQASTISKILDTRYGIKGVEFYDFKILGELDFTTLSEEESDPKNYTLNKSLKFTDCTFKDKIIAKIIFTEPLSFLECEFQKEVNFHLSVFKKGIEFANSIFCENASFSACEFCGDSSSFNDVEFIKELIFSLSTFKKRMYFNNVKFKENSHFKHITSEEEIGFSDSTFMGQVDFGTSKFYDKVNFEDSAFASSFFFIKVNEYLGKSDKNENEDKSKKSVSFNFKGANFKGNAYFRDSFLTNISFSPSQNKLMIFSDVADFSNVKFIKDTDFTEAFFNKVDFSHAIFGYGSGDHTLNLHRCSYKKMIVSWEQISHAILDEDDHKNLKNNFEEMKNYDDACEVEYKMNTIERKRLGFSIPGILNWISQYVIGYGLRICEILRSSVIIILVGALFYAGIKLEPFEYKFSKTKKERKIILTRIPIESNSTQEPTITSKMIHPSTAKGGGSKVWRYLKNLLPAICFSLTLFSKVHFKSAYIPEHTKKWIKRIAKVEWLLGFGFWFIFLYYLYRRSSILYDILSGIPS